MVTLKQYVIDQKLIRITGRLKAGSHLNDLLELLQANDSPFDTERIFGRRPVDIRTDVPVEVVLLPINKKKPSIPPKIAKMPVEQLGLSPRIVRLFKKARIRTTGNLGRKTSDQLLSIPRFRFGSLLECQIKMRAKGINVCWVE